MAYLAVISRIESRECGAMGGINRERLFELNCLNPVKIAELARDIIAMPVAHERVLYMREHGQVWEIAVAVAHVHAESLLAFIATLPDTLTQEQAETRTRVWSSAWLIIARTELSTARESVRP